MKIGPIQHVMTWKSKVILRNRKTEIDRSYDNPIKIDISKKIFT